MKKILWFLLSLTICISPLCFADEVVTDIGQIALTNNQILNWQSSGIWKRFSYVNGHVLGVSDAAPQSSDITSLESQLSGLSDTVPQGVFLSRFDLLLFQTDVFALLPSLSNPDLRLEFGALNTFAQNKDFSGMVQYLGFLQSNGIATQDDVDAVKGCVTKQGVTL